MGMRRRIVLLTSLFCLVIDATSAGEAGRFAVSQLSFQAPTLTAYLDILDQNGQPPGSLTPADLSAKIQGHALKVAEVTSFDASGEGVTYIFLLDVSKSIQRVQFEEMRTAINHWIDDLNGNDRMTIFAFGAQVRQLIDFTADKVSLKAALKNVMPTDLQTKLYLALRDAINLRQRTDAGLSNRLVIVILSDGKDEGSGFTADDVRALVQQSPMPIYAIGSSRLPAKERDEYLEALNRLAILSGGLYVGSGPLSATYNEIRQAIRRVFVVRLTCDACQVNSQSQPLEVTLTTGSVARTAQLAVNLVVPPQPTAAAEPWWKQVISWKLAIPLVLLLGIALIVVRRVVIHNLRKPPPVPPPTEPIPTPVVQPAKVSQPGRRIQLTVVTGKDHGRTDNVNLSGKTVIGRDAGCDVSYPSDSEMSAKHYELILAGEHVEVLDLGTTNGTLLNGARLVTQQRLEDGDLIRAGRTEIRINFGSA